MEQYIILATLALIVGLILWLVQCDKTVLEYTITESEIFPKDMGKGKYFLLNLINTGNKAIENITYKVELNLGKIESLQFTSAINIFLEQAKDMAIINIIQEEE